MKKAIETNEKFKYSKQSLKNAFEKSKKDDDFKRVIKDLDIDEKELMKHTSKIEETVEELKNCKGCKGLFECKNKIKGHVYYPHVYEERLIFSYRPCKYQKKNEEIFDYLNNIYYFDEPIQIREASIKDIDKTDKNRVQVIKWLLTFIEKYKKNKLEKGLYLHGSFGSGKTYLVAATLNELAKQNTRIAIIYYPEFLRELKASFGSNFAEKFNHIKKIPILLLDDIGAENTTPWGRDEILGPILQYRMEESLPTFFTSNLSKKDLENHFSVTKDKTDKVKARRIMERIDYLTEELSLISENRRK